jgi:hypothetical protein
MLALDCFSILLLRYSLQIALVSAFLFLSIVASLLARYVNDKLASKSALATRVALRRARRFRALRNAR